MPVDDGAHVLEVPIPFAAAGSSRRAWCRPREAYAQPGHVREVKTMATAAIMPAPVMILPASMGPTDQDRTVGRRAA